MDMVASEKGIPLQHPSNATILMTTKLETNLPDTLRNVEIGARCRTGRENQSYLHMFRI